MEDLYLVLLAAYVVLALLAVPVALIGISQLKRRLTVLETSVKKQSRGGRLLRPPGMVIRKPRRIEPATRGIPAAATKSPAEAERETEPAPTGSPSSEAQVPADGPSEAAAIPGLPASALSSPAEVVIEGEVGIGESVATRPDSRAARPRDGLESLLGRHVLSVAGAVALFMGSAYFVRLAYLEGWIGRLLGPTARVLAIAAFGFVLLALGKRFEKRRFIAFSRGLYGAGMAVLQIATHAAHFTALHVVERPLVGAEWSFALHVLVTALGFGLATRKRAAVVAALAAFGGFLAPILLQDEGLSPNLSLAFVLVMNVGILAAMNLRRWPWLQLIALAGTYVTFDRSPIHQASGDAALPMTIAMCWIAAFHLLWSIGVIGPCVRGRRDLDGWSLACVAIDLLLSFLMIAAVAGWSDRTTLGIGALILAAGQLAAALSMARFMPRDGRSLAFFTVTIGILTTYAGHRLLPDESLGILLGVEALVLQGASQRWRSRWIDALSDLAIVVSLIAGWAPALLMERQDALMVFNPRFFRLIVGSLLVIIWARRQERSAATDDLRRVPAELAFEAGVISAVMAGLREIRITLPSRDVVAGLPSAHSWCAIYLACCAALLTLWARHANRSRNLGRLEGSFCLSAFLALLMIGMEAEKITAIENSNLMAMAAAWVGGGLTILWCALTPQLRERHLALISVAFGNAALFSLLLTAWTLGRQVDLQLFESLSETAKGPFSTVAWASSVPTILGLQACLIFRLAHRRKLPALIPAAVAALTIGILGSLSDFGGPRLSAAGHGIRFLGALAGIAGLESAAAFLRSRISTASRILALAGLTALILACGEEASGFAVDRLGASVKTAAILVTVLWVTSGAGCMVVGFLRRIADLRRFALFAFMVTSLRLIFVHIEADRSFYRILVFLGSGFVFLVASRAYHEVEKRIGQGPKAPPAPGQPPEPEGPGLDRPETGH